MNDLPLGKKIDYPDRYAPEQLVGIPRAEARSPLGIADPLPFSGMDLWTAWELTWLVPGGKPAVAVADIRIPADSPNIVESKSLKLYLAGFAMSTFESPQHVRDTIEGDLGSIVGSNVTINLVTPDAFPSRCVTLSGTCIDDTPVDCVATEVDAGLLRASGDSTDEVLHSHLLRSLCPVTNQPDSGSVLVRYRGPRIHRASLLRYIASFRNHNDFHEACVERMFLDIRDRCACDRLTVYARYNRRGGIDINPFRTDCDEDPVDSRLWRQ